MGNTNQRVFRLAERLILEILEQEIIRGFGRYYFRGGRFVGVDMDGVRGFQIEEKFAMNLRCWKGFGGNTKIKTHCVGVLRRHCRWWRMRCCLHENITIGWRTIGRSRHGQRNAGRIYRRLSRTDWRTISIVLQLKL